MKHLFLLLFTINFTSIIFAQDYNTIMLDDESEKPMLIGYCTREAFNDTSFSEWWNQEYDLYEVDAKNAEELKTHFEDVEIKLVMSTW